MLRKPKNIIIAVALVSAIAGILSVAHTQLPPIAIPPQTSPAGQPTPGQVSAGDEPAAAAPYQHSNTVKTTSASVVTTPKAASSTPAVKPYVEKPVKYMTINDKQYPIRSYKPTMTPNDPLANQWWVANSKFDQAWDIPAGNHDTLLAIIDSGVALQHQEFTNRWFANSGEQGATSSEAASQLNCTDRGLALNANCNLVDDDGDGIVDEESGTVSYQNPSRLNCTAQGKPLDKSCNRIDDDANGYIDDVQGWDFADMDNSPQAGELNPNGTGTTHGTRVMGVAAAAGNNGQGIAGADWRTKILPIQALDDNGAGDTYGVGRAILYAASMGADVINVSLGSDLPDQYVRETIRIATQAGSLVVASAGNDGCACMVYPANYPEVLSVGALDETNNPASFSSYGPNLDILAPGTNFASTNWTSGNQTSSYVTGISGTSFSAPLISGMLTRLLSQQPSATPLQLIAALTENTNRLSLPATASRNDTLGTGKLDASASTSRMTTPQTNIQAYSLSPVSTGNGLDPLNPYESVGQYNALYCSQNRPGTTPLYELNKADKKLYTISQQEVWSAQEAGYTADFFANICLSQPHDTFSSIKTLDIDHEFRNLYTR